MARSLFFVIPATLAVLASTAWGQVRVVTWNVAQLRGDETSVLAVVDELSLDDRIGTAVPLSVIVMQEVQNADFEVLLAGLGAEWSAATYTNSGEDNYGGAQACFYRADQLTEVPGGHADLYTGAGRRCDRWQFQLIGYSDPIAEFYLYSGHLKAGTGSANQAERLTGAERILEDLAELPPGTAAIVCGDFNIYTNSEPAYQALVDVLADPFGTGSWGGATNAIKHSQSPRKEAADGLASGGMDDRFDFMLTTATLAQSDALSIIDGTLRSVGNDGQHYDEAINNGNNYYYASELTRSNTLANYLHDASDHTPVLADFLLPAELAVGGEPMFGTVIVGAAVSVDIDVTNIAPVGGADLDWVIDALAESGTLVPGGSITTVLEVQTTVPGAFDETLIVDATGDLVQHAPQTVHIAGSVLTHAVPSFSATEQVTSVFLPVTVIAGSGMATEFVGLLNMGWTQGQARLDVDAVTGGIDGLVTAPTSLPGSIAGFPATLVFQLNTDAMTQGNLFASFSVETSDEDLPGETASTLSLTFIITVEAGGSSCEGDVNGDGLVDVADLLGLLDVWQTDDPDADLNDDGTVDVNDLLVLLGDWGC